MVLVLISKGTIDTQGIGLLETLWKVVEAIIDTRRFRAGRGADTAIMGLKHTQELSIITVEGYGAVSRMC